jgi:hypothetical protein
MKPSILPISTAVPYQDEDSYVASNYPPVRVPRRERSFFNWAVFVRALLLLQIGGLAAVLSALGWNAAPDVVSIDKSMGGAFWFMVGVCCLSLLITTVNVSGTAGKTELILCDSIMIVFWLAATILVAHSRASLTPEIWSVGKLGGSLFCGFLFLKLCMASFMKWWWIG